MDRKRLVGFAKDWPLSSPAWAFANLCKAIADVDTALALKMVEGFAPLARTLLSADPISAFRDLRDVFMRVLRLLDILGVYKGKRAPTAQHRQLARSILKELDNRFLAERLSASRLRDFQQTGYLLELVREVAPAKFRSVSDAIDWERIGRTIGDEWKDLPHDVEVLLQVAAQSPTSRDEIALVVRSNLDRIEAFPPRLVLFAPDVAVDHLQRGGLIPIARHGHVDWYYGVPMMAWFAQEHPELLTSLLEPSLPATARCFSQPSSTWYREAAGYVELGGIARKLSHSSLGK